MLTMREGHTLKSIEIDCQDAHPVSIRFTCDGRDIISSERYSDRVGGRIQRYKVGDNPSQHASLLQDAADGIDSAVMSNDGRWIVSFVGKKVAVKNTTTDEVLEVDEHSSTIHAIDVSPDSMRFVTGSEDMTIQVFSITTGKRLLGPLQHGSKIFGVRFSPNGAHIASLTFGPCAFVWDARSGEELTERRVSGYGLAVHPTHCYTPLGWSNNSRRVFVVSSGWISNIDIPGGRMLPWNPRESVPAGNNLTLCSLATNGKFIACSAGGSLSFWDTSSSTQIGPTIEFQESILSIALSPDGSYLACGRGDKKITIYSLRHILPLQVILDVNIQLHPISSDVI